MEVELTQEKIVRVSVPATRLENGCIRWDEYTTPLGYGRHFTDDGCSVYAHAWVWSFYHGAIPEGMFPTQSCGYRGCVEPTHLCLVPWEQWKRDSSGPKQHCRKGHKLTAINTYSYTYAYRGKKGKMRQRIQRTCVSCANEYRKPYREE
jgi:hypothetical protein